MRHLLLPPEIDVYLPSFCKFITTYLKKHCLQIFAKSRFFPISQRFDQSLQVHAIFASTVETVNSQHPKLCFLTHFVFWCSTIFATSQQMNAT